MRIDPDAVRAALDTSWLGGSIAYARETASTNADAKLLGRGGAKHGTLVLCSRQTQGRGRRGRGWTADDGALCFTLILRPDFPMELAPRYVIACAVGVCAGLRRLGAPTLIKWPNDILCDGKKLCGILCEADPSGFVAAGIGINVAQRGFDGDIAGTAGSLHTASGLDPDAPEVLRAVLGECERRIDMCAHEADFSRLLDEYATLSCTLGKSVRVIGADNTYTGEAVALDGLGRLMVKAVQGEVRTVNAADVSIREA